MAIKQCKMCPATFESGNGKERSSSAKTCSDECGKKARREYGRQYRDAHRETIQEHARQYYEATREERIEYARQYRESNPEKVRESDQKYRESNPDKVREIQRKYRKANREKRREIQRLWRKDNPEYYREYSRDRYHRMGGHGYRRLLPALLARFGYVCQINGCELSKDRSKIAVDHIVPISVAVKLGWSKVEINDIANLQPACPSCNSVKKDRWDGTLPGEPPLQLGLGFAA